MEFSEELPQSPSRRSGRYAAEAAEAQAEPGLWGLLTVITPKHASDVKRAGTRARLLAHAVRTGRLVAFRPAGSFEASTRSRSDEVNGKQYAVYVRYMGQPVGCTQ